MGIITLKYGVVKGGLQIFLFPRARVVLRGECQDEFGQLGEAGRVTGAGRPAGDEGNKVSLRDVP